MVIFLTGIQEAFTDISPFISINTIKFESEHIVCKSLNLSH